NLSPIKARYAAACKSGSTVTYLSHLGKHSGSALSLHRNVSLVENVQRAPLHLIDQFRALKAVISRTKPDW
ncbi:MAG: hypothetical protein AAGI36_18495, partial [Pseudomonadota bacterium]